MWAVHRADQKVLVLSTFYTVSVEWNGIIVTLVVGASKRQLRRGQQEDDVELFD
jgi:hypothetical protein